jgi:hypothetical protein
VAGLTFALVVGRRDGLGLDVWLGHAARYARRTRPADNIRQDPQL